MILVAQFATAEDVLLSSESELAKRARIKGEDAKALLRQLSSQLFSAPKHQTAQELFMRSTDGLSTGDKLLDELLRGGLRPGVTEVFGKSGVGKTQLALQLCVMATAPAHLGGLDGGAIYIATEQPFPITRFHDIALSRLPTLDPIQVLDRTHIIHIRDQETQQHVLSYCLSPAIARLKARVVIIDSIAANFRGDEGASELNVALRANMLYEIGRALKTAAHDHQCVIVCLNQVVDVFEGARHGQVLGGFKGASPSLQLNMNNMKLAAGKNEVAPSLGLAWSNMVNTRIKLSRVNIAPGNLLGQARLLDAETAEHLFNHGAGCRGKDDR
ncbi:hypothetical protein PhCBS80983_g03496 [Powellomyces hirtus]|uniref:RecA family profile 1 domain-containing protein n=1 Tax=Powellomyces hirtus TaxID=109895 RepID=A0A507E3P9_9FUNG|nr:hypothetical protein PhCBS80983_g03496 [Powellomyces hirtus]